MYKDGPTGIFFARVIHTLRAAQSSEVFHQYINSEETQGVLKSFSHPMKYNLSSSEAAKHSGLIIQGRKTALQCPLVGTFSVGSIDCQLFGTENLSSVTKCQPTWILRELFLIVKVRVMNLTICCRFYFVKCSHVGIH